MPRLCEFIKRIFIESKLLVFAVVRIYKRSQGIATIIYLYDRAIRSKTRSQTLRKDSQMFTSEAN